MKKFLIFVAILFILSNAFAVGETVYDSKQDFEQALDFDELNYNNPSFHDRLFVLDSEKFLTRNADGDIALVFYGVEFNKIRNNEIFYLFESVNKTLRDETGLSYEGNKGTFFDSGTKVYYFDLIEKEFELSSPKQLGETSTYSETIQIMGKNYLVQIEAAKPNLASPLLLWLPWVHSDVPTQASIQRQNPAGQKLSLATFNESLPQAFGSVIDIDAEDNSSQNLKLKFDFKVSEITENKIVYKLFAYSILNNDLLDTELRVPVATLDFGRASKEFNHDILGDIHKTKIFIEADRVDKTGADDIDTKIWIKSVNCSQDSDNSFCIKTVFVPVPEQPQPEETQPETVKPKASEQCVDSEGEIACSSILQCLACIDEKLFNGFFINN